MRRLRVDIVSDVVCPWCYIGKRRFEAAAKEFPDVEFDVHWRPFQLDNTIPDEGIARETYLSRKFGSPERIAQIYGRIAAEGRAEGIPFAFEKIDISPNTLDAHRLLRWAEQSGAQNALKQRLFDLFFLEGANLADRAVLVKAVEEVGLDGQRVAQKLASDDDKQEVKAEIDEAHRIGVTGVPFFIFDSALALPGAHPSSTIAEAIGQALELKKPAA